MDLTTINYCGTRLFIRREDDLVFREIFRRGVYSKKFEITSEDKFLDIGMHVGLFVAYCRMKGADVIGFEPERESFKIAKINGEGYMGLHNKAVVGNDDKRRILYLNVRESSGASSFFKTKKIKGLQAVECVNINDVLMDNITGIKIDVEGSEWEIIKAIKDFKNVKKIMIEYHMCFLGKKYYLPIVKILKNAGFKVYYDKELRGKATYIYAIKK